MLITLTCYQCYLANNLDYRNARLPSGLTVVANGGAPLPNTLTGSVVVDMNGESVGIIGVVTPYLKSIANAGRVNVTTLDEDGNPITPSTPIDEQVDSIIANITPEVQALTSSGVNKLILMTHLQESAIERALAQRMADLGLGIDVHIGGGSHQVMATGDGIPPLREDETQQINGQLLQPYPQAYSNGENTVYYINTGANYRYLSQLVATFDENGKIISIGDDSGTYATDIAGVDRLYDEEITTIEQVKAKADPEVVAIVEGVENFVNKLDGNVFGQTDFFLNGTRGDVRTQETNLGNLASDAQDFYGEAYLNEHNLLPGFSEINISFKNGGGIRDNIGVSFIAGGTNELVQLPPQANPAVGKEEGDVSELDILNSLRFNNDLVVGTVTAEGLLQIAEHMVSAVELTSGRFGQISGFNFSFDPTAPAGSRIQTLALTDEGGNILKVIADDGELLVNATDTYSVVTLGFLARNLGQGTAGDGYPLVIQNQVALTDFTEPDELGKSDNTTSGGEQDALAEYLAAFFNKNNGQSPFAEEDTPPSEDERVQNLNFRSDTVLEGTIQGDDGANTLLGTVGNDVILARGGNDTAAGGLGDDLIYGEDGDDVLRGDANSRSPGGKVGGNDTIYGGNGNDRIGGKAGNDQLFGQDGNDEIWGDDGDDLLWGGLGNDLLRGDDQSGGKGSDIFVLTEGEGTDTIADFQKNIDKIGLAGGIDFSALTLGGNEIKLGTEILAVLNNVNTATLAAADFISQGKRI